MQIYCALLRCRVLRRSAVTSPAQALTTQECSAKYKAAKDAARSATRIGTIFRKASAERTPRGTRRRAGCRTWRHCRTRSAEAAEAKGEEGSRFPPRRPPRQPALRCFPSAVDPKYSKETTGKGDGTLASINTTPTRPPTQWRPE